MKIITIKSLFSVNFFGIFQKKPSDSRFEMFLWVSKVNDKIILLKLLIIKINLLEQQFHIYKDPNGMKFDLKNEEWSFSKVKKRQS